MYYTHLLHSAKSSFVAAVLMVTLGVLSYFAFEPTISRSATAPEDGQFTVTQNIGESISFIVTPGDVSMVGSIDGLAGGYATGTTYVVVRTNNATGYNMTLQFADAGSTNHAMQASSSAYINNYSPTVVGTPDYSWEDNTSGQPGEFGYTVRASSTGEVAQIFQNDGASTCNTGSSEDDNTCWMSPTTTGTGTTIVNSSAPSSGSTSTIKFKIVVPNAPSPSLPSGVYVATGTLTATTNP